jgi:hypothetical protein
MFGVLFDYMHWTGGRKCGFLSSSTCFSQNIEFADNYDDQTGRMVRSEPCVLPFVATGFLKDQTYGAGVTRTRRRSTTTLARTIPVPRRWSRSPLLAIDQL